MQINSKISQLWKETRGLTDFLHPCFLKFNNVGVLNPCNQSHLQSKKKFPQMYAYNYKLQISNNKTTQKPQGVGRVVLS